VGPGRDWTEIIGSSKRKSTPIVDKTF
jgi:hypothetical protein